jgi:hypothetical protein
VADPQVRSSVDDYLRRWQALDEQYLVGNWKDRQREAMQFIQPYRGRFELSEQNKQPRKDQSIINDTATYASKNLSAALLVGLSSAARKWVAFTSNIPEIRDDHECKDYFDEFRDVVLQICAESNFYKVLAQVYDDLVCPATSLMWIEEDERDIIRAVHRPCGQYRLACDSRGRVSTVYERFSMTVEQVVEKFCLGPGRSEPDLSKLSDAAHNLYRDKKYDEWIDILHVVEPRTLRQYGKIDARNKPWSSCWMEYLSQQDGRGNATNQPLGGAPRQLLLESGFDEQAFIAPRWDATGEDAYGCNSPGLLTIGDTKALQIEETGSGKLFALMLSPPMNVPPQLHSGSLVPGAKNMQEDNSHAKFEPSYVPDHQTMTVAAAEKRELEKRINRGHYGEILFLISQDPRATPATAEEIRAKKEEKLLQLGGFGSRFTDEGLTVALNRIGAIAQRKRLIRPPPQKLIEAAMKGGRILKPEYLNSIAEAQKAQGVQPILGWVNDVMAMAKETADPEILDNVDFDGVSEMTADLRGVPARLVVPEEMKRQKRARRAQAQAQARAAEAAPQLAGAAKDLSSVNPDNLREMARQFGPAAEAEAAGNGL